ncbi:hypothetical protein PROVRUST_08256 [Providencia rustigianii DSM 4541]|uniref:Uncharacterized protein n=1 Tax=Providencia rustigianii DSM 4541 TaxID=500637 RepID=D1P7N3_9GAMM|nr:hypothetical protein PROVRUST_08256 [Providencia rustigianii DSM 4541]SUC28945.1 Uncharacterised protein [Providencia rustigianii]
MVDGFELKLLSANIPFFLINNMFFIFDIICIEDSLVSQAAQEHKIVSEINIFMFITFLRHIRAG